MASSITGIINLPIESIVGLKREYLAEKDWMPEEVGILLNKIEKETKKLGIDWLYATREAAPRNVYPYPNIFKDPKKTNLARDLKEKKKIKDIYSIISSDFVATPRLKQNLAELKNGIKKATKNTKTLKSKWLDLILKRRQVARDYNLSANIKILSSVAWRVWGDKKRHRTVPMIVESVYYCIERAAKIFSQYKSQIKNHKLNKKALDNINSVFSIPPTVLNNKDFLYGYLERALDSFETYQNLIKRGVKHSDALFIIPRGLKLDVLQDYNFYNLIAGYYPLRICSTAEEELRRLSIKEVAAIKKLLKQKDLEWLAEHIVPKCHAVGFCLEEKYCSMIKSLVPDYNEKIHEEMKQDLENKFQKFLRDL